MNPELITLVVAAIVVLAEAVHWARLRRTRFLVFGPGGRTSLLAMLAPIGRVAGISLACWGFLTLLFVVEERVHNSDKIDDSDYKHLVLVVDVSPSMHLKDAGPQKELTRRQRAADIVESLFSRVPMRQFKVTLIGVYTDAKPLIEDSTDHEAMRYILEELPMWHAFKPGKTKLMDGINQAAKISKPWNPNSTFVVLLTDGDTVPAKGMPKLPASVAEFVVVGVGDSTAGQFIDGHQSRQDISTLRQVANRLQGTYHNGNEKHLSSRIVGRFIETSGDDSIEKWSLREYSLAAILLGSFLFTIIPLVLHYFGSRYRAGVPLGKQAGQGSAA